MMKGERQSQILKKTTKILAGMNIDVHTEGFSPRVEYDPATKKPKAVFIPEIPDDADDALVNAMHGYIDHECGHILESSSDDICDTTKSQLWHYIHNCIEDPRINAKMAERYHGVGPNLRAGYNYLINKVDETTGRSAYSKEAVDEIDLSDPEAVKDAQCRYSSVWFAKKANCKFHGPVYDEMDLDRLYDPLEAKMDPKYLDALGRIKTTEEVVLASDYYKDFFHKEFDEKSPSGGGKGGSKAGGAGAGPGRLEELKSTEERLGEAIKNTIEHLAKESKKNWHFSDRWDRLHTKFDITAKASPAVSGFENETRTIANYLTKDLRRLLESRNRRWWVGGFKSGRLNQKVLHSVRVGNDRIFSKKSEVRDVKAAVGLLIDLSGSMSGSKVMMAAQSAYAFALVLEQLKVPYEIWGFSTGGTNPQKSKEWEKLSKTLDPAVVGKVIAPVTTEDFFCIKDFNSAFDIIAKSALVAMGNSSCGMRNNEDSVHVKRALERLATRREDKKTLFVFSDGQPAYSPGNLVNTHEMLKYLDRVSLSNYGVEMFGIGIMSDAVKHYYKHNKVVKKLEELPTALFEFLKTRI